jgi:hypothetical protein
LDGKKLENIYYDPETTTYLGGYGVAIFIDKLAAGETVTLTGAFHVPLENAENVTYLAPTDPELLHIIPPSIDLDLFSGAGNALIPISIRAQLERWDGTRWVIVEKYSRDYRERANAALDAFLENLS